MALFGGVVLAALREPGASGSTAGLEGAVVRVTTLAASGRGSLRAALEARGPRLVVFEVGGVVDLDGASLVVTEPHVTIAGQTAPDPGITLIRGSLSVETYDVAIQHLAVRPGDSGRRKGGAWEPDAMGTRRGSGPVHDVVFDHCSATWAVDENLSVSGPADVALSAVTPHVTSHDVSLRFCLVAEGLSLATHSKGEHSKGTLVHDGVQNVMIVGSLFAHNRERNPRLKGGARAAVVNNVVYNWGAAAIGMGSRGNARELAGAEAAVVGNVAIAGPDTTAQAFVKSMDPGAAAFLRDNLVVDARGAALRLADPGIRVLAAPPAWPPNLVAIPARQSLARVLRRAGARPARRDPIDARIVDSVIRGTGRIIDSQEQVGGHPVRPSSARTLDVPEGVEARRRWLEGLAAALEIDDALDVRPLFERLGLTTAAR